ncbi:hypothetical protein P7K49_031976, partial [Saguinus oedipus]
MVTEGRLETGEVPDQEPGFSQISHYVPARSGNKLTPPSANTKRAVLSPAEMGVGTACKRIAQEPIAQEHRPAPCVQRGVLAGAPRSPQEAARQVCKNPVSGS